MGEDNGFHALGSGLGEGHCGAQEAEREGARCWVGLSKVRGGSDEAQPRALLRPGASGSEVTGAESLW